jgi:RNA polymerase sigma factor (sigma-70 family)
VRPGDRSTGQSRPGPRYESAARAFIYVTLDRTGSPLAPPTANQASPLEPGARERWQQRIAQHDHRVVVALLARGASVDQARDLAQQAWLKLIEGEQDGSIERLDLPGLAIRQAGFLLRDDRRRVGELLPAGEDLHETTAVDERLVGREQLAQASAILLDFPPSAQRVFELAYGGGGLAHAEVARRCGLSVQRVRQILCEVRARLRAALLDERR